MWRRGASRGWVALAVLAGCRQILGVEERSEGHPPAPRFTFDESPACTTCTSGNCDDESEACWADPACRPIFTCIADECELGDETCRAGCSTSPNEAAFTLAACHAQHCGADCALDCGGIVGMAIGVVLPHAQPACATCAADTACSTYRACAESPECVAFGLCRVGCPAFDLGCRRVCGETHQLGHDFYLELNAAFAPCLGTCTIEPDWYCRETVSWPTPTRTESVGLELFVYGYPDNNPIQGATVTACDDFSSECVPVGDDAEITDAAGRALVEVPVAGTLTGAFHGYLEVIPPGTPEVMPLLAYPAVFPASSQFLGSLPVSNRLLFEQLALLAGITFDDGQGVIGVFVTDCTFNPARGVRVTLEPADAGARTLYFKNGVADVAATETDQGAIMGFINVKPGRVTLTAETEVDGKTVVVSRRQVWVREDAETYIQLAPTP